MAVAAVVIVLMTQDGRAPKVAPVTDTEVSSQAKRIARFAPTPAQWAALGMEPVKAMTFRSEHMTEGKISINEDRATPIFPPYAGRVTRLMAKPGDMVERGQPLFYIEAADMVQAQNDFLTALAGINRAKSRVTITEIIEKQNRTLYEGKAGALRDFQTATADLAQARADLRTAESALEAARNRLAILGKTDAEIAAFQDQGKISSETPIYAPLSGTVVQRKIGPGQYVSYTSTGASTRSSPSATCRPCGSSPMSARAKRRRSASDSSSISPCSPIPRRRSRRTSTMWPRRSIRTSAA